jgi:Xaa-Pro aminopeptidase
MKLKTLSEQEIFEARLQRVQQELKNLRVDGCLIEDPLDLLYFTGLKLSCGKLLVCPTDILLLVDSRYLPIAKERALCPFTLDTEDHWFSFCRRCGIHRLGFDGRHTSYDHFLHLRQKKLELISCSALFKEIRSIKDPLEIAKMKKSAHLLWRGFEFICSTLKAGVTEREVAKTFEIFCLQNGADALSFEPIIAFGPHSAIPHHRSENVSLMSGDVVLVDIGVAIAGYHSDMTRTLFFETKHPYLSKLYKIVQKAQRTALELCRPGQTVGQIDLAARKVFKEEGVEELFIHGLGHGIGLEVHEFPRIKYDGVDKDAILKSGMVVTIEPGLYVPGIGGVRYEDTIVITDDGYENLYPTKSEQ